MGAYPSGHKDPNVAALIFLLDDWLAAMESGTASMRFPDPNYVRPNGKALWTEEELDKIILDIDAEIDIEVNRTPGTSVGADAGPGFHRLEMPQRLALVQQLETMLEEQEASVAVPMD